MRAADDGVCRGCRLKSSTTPARPDRWQGTPGCGCGCCVSKTRRGGARLSDLDWSERCIEFVEEHPFRTRYAQLEYNRGRADNLVKLHNLLREQREEAAEESAQAEKAERSLGNTVEDLYTDITRDQWKLLSVADRRTATMVHVNAIMISLIVALLLRHIDTHPHLLAPTLVLLAVNLVSVLISILSMRAPRSLKRPWQPDKEASAAHDKNLPCSRTSCHDPRPVPRVDGKSRARPPALQGPGDLLHAADPQLARGMLRLTYDVSRWSLPAGSCS
jgi:hypothetical protein